MLRRQSDGNHFEKRVSHFTAIGVVGGFDVIGRATEQDDAYVRRFLFAVEIIETLRAAAPKAMIYGYDELLPKLKELVPLG